MLRLRVVSGALAGVLLMAIGAESFQAFTPMLVSNSRSSPRNLPHAIRARAAKRQLGALRMVAAPPQADFDEPEKIVEGPFQGEFGTWVWAFDVCAALFLASFGVSLSTIHIYMKPLHNMLKVLWGSGVLGALAVIASDPGFGVGLRGPHGPFLQRVRLLPGGHFLGVLDGGAEGAILDVLAFFFCFFAARKFSQPLKADIGDKTVFEFLALKEQQEAREQAQQ